MFFFLPLIHLSLAQSSPDFLQQTDQPRHDSLATSRFARYLFLSNQVLYKSYPKHVSIKVTLFFPSFICSLAQSSPDSYNGQADHVTIRSKVDSDLKRTNRDVVGLSVVGNLAMTERANR